MAEAIAEKNPFQVKGADATREEYIEQTVRNLQKSGMCMVVPEAILGFQEGAAVDLKPYDQIDFTHPRQEIYYSLDNAQFKEKFDDITATGDIEDPIVVFPYTSDGKTEILCLDGVTRLSIIGLYREKNPDAFRRIKCMLFRGTFEQAKGAMVRYNLEGRSTPLSGAELMDSIDRFVKWGWEDAEILTLLGKAETWKPTLHKYKKAAEALIDPIKKAFHKGIISADVAHECARLEEKEQEKISKTIEKKTEQGEKIRGKDIKKETAAKKNLDPIKRLNQISENQIEEVRSWVIKRPTYWSQIKDDFEAMEDAIQAVIGRFTELLRKDEPAE